MITEEMLREAATKSSMDDEMVEVFSGLFEKLRK